MHTDTHFNRPSLDFGLLVYISPLSLTHNHNKTHKKQTESGEQAFLLVLIVSIYFSTNAESEL